MILAYRFDNNICDSHISNFYPSFRFYFYRFTSNEPVIGPFYQWLGSEVEHTAQKI